MTRYSDAEWDVPTMSIFEVFAEQQMKTIVHQDMNTEINPINLF
jgi:hypothetical protein